jgi:hypothetical protein
MIDRHLTSVERSLIVLGVGVFLLVILLAFWPEPAAVLSVGVVTARRGALEAKRWRLVRALTHEAPILEKRQSLLQEIKSVDERLNNWP